MLAVCFPPVLTRSFVRRCTPGAARRRVTLFAGLRISHRTPVREERAHVVRFAGRGLGRLIYLGGPAAVTRGAVVRIRSFPQPWLVGLARVLVGKLPTTVALTAVFVVLDAHVAKGPSIAPRK